MKRQDRGEEVGTGIFSEAEDEDLYFKYPNYPHAQTKFDVSVTDLSRSSRYLMKLSMNRMLLIYPQLSLVCLHRGVLGSVWG
jgi:hypothetical protein